MVDDVAELPQPSAEGTLARTPFPHLLVYAHDRELSGTMEFRAPSGESATLLFLDGQPVKVRTSETIAYLGRVLLELEHITESALNFSLRKLAEKKQRRQLHGQILLEAGSITNEQLREGLRVQLHRKLQHLVRLPAETAFAYYDAFDALASYGGDEDVSVHAYAIVWGAIREQPPWDQVHEALKRVGAAGLRVKDAAAVDQFGFDPAEREVIEMLRERPYRLHDLSTSAKLQPRITQLLAYCLLITKQVDLIRESQVPAPLEEAEPDEPPPSAPSSSRRSLSAGDIPPASPSSSAVARLQLQAQAQAKHRAAVEARAEGLPWDDRLTPPPMNAPVGLKNPLIIPTAGAFLPPGSPVVPSQALAAPRPPAGDPVFTKPTVRSMSAVRVPAPSPAPATPAPATPALPTPAPPAEPRAAPAEVTPEIFLRKKEILAKAAKIDKENYFEMLGVSRDSTAEQVQAAYFALAKVWHPDRTPAALADVKQQCARVFAHMSEAHKTLIDAEKRRSYMTLLRDGGATPESQAEITRVVEAATNFQKAEICMRRNDVAQAEELCKKAVEADPQADYIALHVWLESMKPANQTPDKSEGFIQRLDKAITMNARCERAFFYRGMIHKRLRHEAAAVKDFRKASELNPRNIDAQREVRLFDMRKGGTPSTPPVKKKGEEEKSGGLFGKLFKK